MRLPLSVVSGMLINEKKKMMKGKILQIVSVWMIMAVLMFSCEHEEGIGPSFTNAASGDYITVDFTIDQSDFTEVDSRSVDPDGQDISNLALFCFNSYGLYMSIADQVTLQEKVSDGVHLTKGKYTARIPKETSIIHFLANQNPELYNKSEFFNKTEAYVLAEMEGASGMMIYWNRFEKTGEGDIKEQLSALTEGIKLVRNQAKVTVEVDEAFKESFILSGFVVTGIHAFGTVAPYCKDHGFVVHNIEDESHNIVTLPKNRTMMSDITDINTKPEDYIFEHENTYENPVSVIVKGKHAGESQDSYYRAMLINHDTGDLYPVIRNHHYKVKIVGNLSYGKPTFEEALNGPATNNVWVSVDSWVKEVTDNQYVLALEETSKVFDAKDLPVGGTYMFRYTLKKAAGNTDTDPITAPEVMWQNGNNVANQDVNHQFDTSTGKGTIEITLAKNDGNIPELTGSLIVRKGRLYRTIDISMISTQKFTPSWIDSQVYGGLTGQNVTLMFTIPETCPKSLFPFSVLISANELDVRRSSGMQLPILKDGDPGFFGNTDAIYKYEYVVKEPGTHRVFLHTMLEHTDDDKENVTLEARYFESITKTVSFKNPVNTDEKHRAIFLENLDTYHDNVYAADEELYYMLVPQKKASPHMFTIVLKELNGNTYGNLAHDTKGQNNEHDEFLLYTQNLTFYDEYFKNDKGRYENILNDAWQCEVVTFDDTNWSTNGRVMGFRTYGYDQTYPWWGLRHEGKYNLYVLTNGTDNRDLVRVSSNVSDSPCVFQYERTALGQPGSVLSPAKYAGNEYRSFVFDVSHYRPFRFAAQVEIGNEHAIPATVYSNKVNKDAEEPIDPVVFTYVPNQEVDIMLDVTSFEGQNGRSVHPFGEDFGEAFKIFIDAPMLEIDDDRIDKLYSGWDEEKRLKFKEKFKKESDGRFSYTVDRLRNEERKYGYQPAMVTDDAEVGYDRYGGVFNYSSVPESKPSQNGERKLLPFKKTSITANGNIVISSDKEQVVFWTKTFHVSTERIKGKIQYNDGTEVKDIPKDAFVSLVYRPEDVKTRIGSVTVGELKDGKNFSLNLRGEYNFAWNGENHVVLNYRDREGKDYDIQFTNLEELYDFCQGTDPIILKEATTPGS